MKTRALTAMLLLPVGYWSGAMADESGPVRPCPSVQRDVLLPLGEYFAQHGIKLTCVHRGGMEEWVVVHPQDQDVEVFTKFRVFPRDVTSERMNSEMSVYNLGSFKNHAARIAMFFPSGRCTTQGVDCKAGFDRVRALQQRLIDLFQAYAP